jgi:hypothetical protein
LTVSEVFLSALVSGWGAGFSFFFSPMSGS